MQNINLWKPTKFIKKGFDEFTSNTEKEYVGPGYQYLVTLQAVSYSALIRKYAGKNLLDLGCGDMPLYEMYKDKADNVYCCDWNSSYHNNYHLDFILNLNESLPIKDSVFDTVILSDVLEHLIYPEKIFSEIARILCEDGILFISVPFLHPIHEEPYDYSRFTEYKLMNLCQVNKFKILHLEAYGGSFDFFADFILKHLSRIRPHLITIILKKMFWSFTSSSLGRKVFNKTKHKYPVGYCLIAKK